MIDKEASTPSTSQSGRKQLRKIPCTPSTTRTPVSAFSPMRLIDSFSPPLSRRPLLIIQPGEATAESPKVKEELPNDTESTCADGFCASESATSSATSVMFDTSCEREGDGDQDFFDNYVCSQLLGRGTFSTVHRATSRADGAVAAVKCVRNCDEEQRKATLSEYRLMCRLDHPSLVRAHDLYECGRSLWLIMDLLQGGDLNKQIQKRGKFSEEETMNYSLQLLEGLAYLHDQRVIHRDVKPPNILLSEDGTKMKLTDFNSAMVIGEATAGDGKISFRGTRCYSAPEVVYGSSWNEKIDVWACGLCIYFMLRAKLPYDIGNRDVLTCLMKRELPEISWNKISPTMQGMVMQCLVPNMEQRPSAESIWMHFSKSRQD